MKGDNIAERLLEFGARVVRLVRALPSDRTGRHVSDQLLRSGTSGGSNYEEARSAQSRRDFVHKVSLAAKEMREALYWNALIDRVEPDSAEDVQGLLEEGKELIAVLMSSAKTARGEQGIGAGNRNGEFDRGIRTGNTNDR